MLNTYLLLPAASPPFSFSSSLSSLIFSSSKFRRRIIRSRKGLKSSSISGGIKAMPSAGGGNEDVSGGGFYSFKLNESAFLASLMPKKEIAADRFIEANPEFDGRGAVIAIFDSGVDPAAAGLQETSDGKPKILDILDCSGSGDVDISKVVKADADGCIIGASGANLVVNSAWDNPSGDWHVGCKLIYDLFTDTLTSRLKRERKKDWDEKNQEEIAKAVKVLDDFDQEHIKVVDPNLKRAREDLQNQIDILKKQADCYNDKGPVIDAVVWHDGEVWRVALDTQSLEDESDPGKLANFVPLTNYKIERKYGVFSKLDACTFVVNVFDEGNILSIVTDCSPHGTHVAGIAAAFHPKEPLLNGVAPGAQLISCKIGDSRLGSMETGTGLTRALIAAVEHKCDLINMSYGEPTLLPDYGRFIDLVDEAVNKYRIIFVSSAGNSGPALNTVGAPGGTSSSIIGVGAYVSPSMAAGAHCVVEAPSEGLEYTWSSRGPTADGDLGVCVSAPGAAVAPVPTWTLQRRMLMNGTSMASPSACGGIALLISAMKAENIPVSPYLVRKALENTANPVGCLPEDTLSTGQGLMQVDKAYEYIRKSQNVPNVWYKVKINQSGKSSPTTRGIYLREASACRQLSEWTVQVEPQFHKDASNLKELVPFEECIELHSSEKTVVTVPDYLLLTHNGRSFNIVVDPSNLSDGLHFYELYGVDCKAPWRGPLFRIPVTITKPIVVVDRPPLVSFPRMSFLPGHIERRFIEVPHGACWVEATMQTTGFDTTRKFFIDTVQILPLKRPMKWESVVTCSSPTSKSFCFPVVGGQTMELAIAQFWSSGIGSRESSLVDFEIKFHGISTNKDEIVLDGSEAPVRIDAEALLASEKLTPAAILNKLKVPYRPCEAKICTLPTDRDRLPSGKQILALTLTYKFKLEDCAEVKPVVPLFNNRIYDNKFESQFYMISDANKRIYAMGDAYPNVSKLPKGEYILRLRIRHEDVQFLEKMKQLVVFIERKLEEKESVKLSFFSQPDGPVTGKGAYKSSVLVPGKKEAFYLSPPLTDKIPKNSPQGSFLLGAISYGKLGFFSPKDKQNPLKMPVYYQISFVVPPTKLDEDKSKGSSPTCTKTVSERLKEEIRDAKIKVLSSLKPESVEEYSEWKKLSSSLKSEYPKYTPLLAKILEGLISVNNVKDKILHDEEVIDSANEVADSVDKDDLAKFFALKYDPEDEEMEKIKKKMETTRDQFAEALYQKGLAMAEIESLKVETDKASTFVSEGAKDVSKADDLPPPAAGALPDSFEENFRELKKWVDIKSPKYGALTVLREKRCGRLGTALKVLSAIEGYGLEDFISSSPTIPSKTVTGSDQTNPSPNPEFLKWKRQDRLLSSWLSGSMSESILAEVTDCESSSEVWSCILNLFSSQNMARIMQYKSKLQTQKKEGLSMKDYLSKMKAYSNALSSVKHKITEEDLIMNVLEGLGTEYDSIVSVITASPSQSSFKEISALLLSHEGRIQRKFSTSESTLPSVNLSVQNKPEGIVSHSGQNQGNQFNRGKGKNNRGGRYGYGNRPQCQLCNKVGHTSLKCYSRFDPNYHGPNHNGNGNLSQSYSGNTQTSYGTSAHYPNTGRSSHPNQSSYSQSSTATAYLASNDLPSDSNWCPDSGASHHVTNDLSNLNLGSEYQGPNRIQMGNGTGLHISHTGYPQSFA